MGCETEPSREPIDFSVFDDVVDGVLACTDDGRYVYANAAALQIYGHPEIVGRSIGDFAAEPSNGELDETWATLRRDGIASGESVIRTADDRLKRVRFRVSATCQAGVYLSVISAATPGGAPRVGRESARAELFHSVFEYAPEALLVADDRRRYLAGNRMARSFLGLSRQALVGKHVDDVVTRGAQPRLEQLWTKFLAGGTMTGTLPIVLANGLRRNVFFRARASVRPGRHLISFQLARPDRLTPGLELSDRGPAQPLTFREREILTLIARGSSAKAIAEDATLSADTVRTHVRNAMKKLGAKTRSHAIAIAIGLRQIDP